jgi:hypothetical protein
MAKQKWPVGETQIAVMFGVAPTTPTRWLYRSRKGRMHPPMPEPDGEVSGTPWWWDTTMEQWGTDSNRRLVCWPVAGQMVPIPAAPTPAPAAVGNGRRAGGRVIPVPVFRGPGEAGLRAADG